MARRRFYRRGFLNNPGQQSIALYLAEARHRLMTIRHGSHKGEKYIDLTAELTLGDCNRQITLEFGVDSDNNWDQINNVAHKARVLREVVNGFLDTVDEGVERVRRFKINDDIAEGRL
jgi:hypothetical protein